MEGKILGRKPYFLTQGEGRGWFGVSVLPGLVLHSRAEVGITGSLQKLVTPPQLFWMDRTATLASYPGHEGGWKPGLPAPSAQSTASESLRRD